MKQVIFSILLLSSLSLWAQENINTNKFRQLGNELPTPNTFRTASGAPGSSYWQQQADYVMDVKIDEQKQVLSGEETITYTNNSPDNLEYLWLQLDQNVRAKSSDSYKIRQSSIDGNFDLGSIAGLEPWFEGGFNIESVTDASGSKMDYTINKTMMRIDPTKELKSGGSISFKIKWWYNINDRMKVGGRSGYEFFEADGNSLYTIAQFFPRMCVYSDVEGWQNKQFLGNGEFALPFGDYKVSITVPSDHIVGSTGELKNAKSVLTSEQRKRFEKAKTADEPVIIVTQEEAEKAEKGREKGMKTWIFHAENVRDFGFATSRKFIWDAMGVQVGDNHPMAMSYYPKEGNPLWEQFSTRAVAQTLRTYSKHTIDYPYPVAISVNGKDIGMEYPMICFNYGRPEADGTYTARLKHGMIGVIIHEVGHNFFPMIINSDERQWTWMDEGLNTFVQFLTEKEFDKNYPSRRGPARNIVGYMAGDKSRISPIMTNSESIFQFGNNAYGKPATALNILRETVMGRDLFDHAFKTYCQRWAFKHPAPADLFRTMEDASAVDLDWFWRGWFYTTDHVDISMSNVKYVPVGNGDVTEEKANDSSAKANEPKDITQIRNEEEGWKSLVETDPKAVDFYTNYDENSLNMADVKAAEEALLNMSEEDKNMLGQNFHLYELSFENLGGLVMPLIVEFQFADGTSEIRRIPAEIWKMGDTKVTKVFKTEKKAISIALDPYLETADTDTSNNYWPSILKPSDFKLFKYNSLGNPMQKSLVK